MAEGVRAWVGAVRAWLAICGEIAAEGCAGVVWGGRRVQRAVRNPVVWGGSLGWCGDRDEPG